MIEFEAGYYEWQVRLNGEVVYAFDELVDQIPYPLREKEELEDTVDDLIEEMEWQLDSGEKEIDASTKEELYENLGELKELMISRLFSEYGEAA